MDTGKQFKRMRKRPIDQTGVFCFALSKNDEQSF
jgi:hypothetical protein